MNYPELRTAMFVDEADSIVLTGEGLGRVKAAVMYGNEVDLYSPAAQMTSFLQDLIDTPAPTLLNISKGFEMDHPTLIQHGNAGAWAARRILAQHLPELSGMRPLEASRRLDEFKRWMVREDVDGLGLRAWSEVNIAIQAGRVVLRDCLDTAPDGPDGIPSPYEIDHESHLADALARTDTAVLCDDFAASRIRCGSRVRPTVSAEARAGVSAVGSGLIAKLPIFPEAPMDEVIGLTNDLESSLRRYRIAAADFRRKMTSGPFDQSFPEELEVLWHTEVCPSVEEIEDEMKAHSWVKGVIRRREALGTGTLGVLGSVVALGVSPYLDFLNPEWINHIRTAAVAIGTPSAVVGLGKEFASVKSDNRLAKDRLASNNLFYLYEASRRLS